ncbi:hypothetical protein NHX12_030280, partial [Muraenolepis orangiensis]
MSLPTKVVPKPAAVAVSGPGGGPSPSGQLRAALTSVSLPPGGAPLAAQPVAALPPQHAGPPYATHDITKGHPSLACTPPGHAHSPALSQVSLATASQYRYPKGWETGPGFFQRAQMQTARPTLPANQPSLRPGSQNPTAAVYPPNQPIMMAMAPMPFPSPQAAQYYIPQYRHSTPYVGPPQQYSVQAPGAGAFYSAPGHGDFSTPYHPLRYHAPVSPSVPAPVQTAGPAYYQGQTPGVVFPPSPPIIVPTPQQPPPAKREKKTIRIRDPTQGGRDITEEIMSGGSGSRNPTPPVMGRPSSTPTPPQVGLLQQHETPKIEMPKVEPALQKSSSPGPVQPDPAVKRREASPPVITPDPPAETPELPSATPAVVPLAAAPLPVAAPANAGEKPSTSPKEPKASLTPSPQTPNTDEPLPEPPRALETPAATPDKRPEVLVASPEAHVAPKAPVAVVPVTLSSSSTPVVPMPAPPPGLPPLVQATAEVGEPSKPVDIKSLPLKVGLESHTSPADGKSQESQPQALTRKSPTTVCPTSSAAPKSWRKPNEVPAGEAPQKDSKEEPRSAEQAVATQQTTLKEHPALTVTPTVTAASAPPEENGETEPMRNGAGHASETESSDSGSGPGDKESSGAPDVEDLALANGKRQYKREFLLGFQFKPACVQKPEGLPPISDVVLDKINQTKLPSRVVEPRVISRGPDFTPAFADFGRQMTGGRGAPMMNMVARRPPPRKIIMTVSEDVQLQKAENAWKPGMKREVVSEVSDSDAGQTQELFRKVRSILNKLTPQMFNQLMKQVTDLSIDTEERLKGVIDLVFEKAINEPGFSVAYGNMCRCFATLKVQMTDKPNTTVNFRMLLLNRCQKEFEKDKVDDVVFERKQRELDSAGATTERERLQGELKEAKDKARRRSIGNIRFIGELFKLKMLTEAIMHDCVVKLLKNHDEESQECLCRLLTTIGKDLDFAKAKPRMDQYFRQMEKIVKERKTSSRIRFMLQDIIDLRLHDWVSRRADQGPKTIEQIHKEAKIEEQEEQRKVHQQMLNKDTKRRPGRQVLISSQPTEEAQVPPQRGEQRDREQREQRDQREPWSTVPMTKNSRTIDPTKIMMISKPQMDEKIQLGPQVSWIMGSSGGAKASDSAQNADYDSRRTLGSRSMARERGDKTPSSSPSPSPRPGPFTRGGSSKDLLEGPEEPREKEPREKEPREKEPREKEEVEPRRPSVTEEKTEPERSRAKEPTKSEPADPSPDGLSLPEEVMERKSKSIIEEFLHINDVKEAMQCVYELKQASQLQVFVRVGVESTLERSQLTRQHMGQLFFQLLQHGVLPKAQFCSGFADTLEQADEMAIDIPHIWLYLAELLSPVLSERGFSMRELFSELSKPLLPVGRAGVLFSEILHILCKNMSHSKVAALWRESGLNWSHFLSEGEDVQTFISQQKLQFTESEGCSPDAAESESTLPPEELSRQLDRLLLEDMASDEQVFDWVEANLDESQMSSSPFLRALMTAVCKAAVKEPPEDSPTAVEDEEGGEAAMDSPVPAEDNVKVGASTETNGEGDGEGDGEVKKVQDAAPEGMKDGVKLGKSKAKKWKKTIPPWASVAASKKIPAAASFARPQPRVDEVLLEAVKSSTCHSGMSYMSVLKYMTKKYPNLELDKKKYLIKKALKKYIEKGTIKQLKGKGLSGSFAATKQPPTKLASKKPALVVGGKNETLGDALPLIITRLCEPKEASYILIKKYMEQHFPHL